MFIFENIIKQKVKLLDLEKGITKKVYEKEFVKEILYSVGIRVKVGIIV